MIFFPVSPRFRRRHVLGGKPHCFLSFVFSFPSFSVSDSLQNAHLSRGACAAARSPALFFLLSQQQGARGEPVDEVLPFFAVLPFVAADIGGVLVGVGFGGDLASSRRRARRAEAQARLLSPRCPRTTLLHHSCRCVLLKSGPGMKGVIESTESGGAFRDNNKKNSELLLNDPLFPLPLSLLSLAPRSRALPPPAPLSVSKQPPQQQKQRRTSLSRPRRARPSPPYSRT